VLTWSASKLTAQKHPRDRAEHKHDQRMNKRRTRCCTESTRRSKVEGSAAYIVTNKPILAKMGNKFNLN